MTAGPDDAGAADQTPDAQALISQGAALAKRRMFDAASQAFAAVVALRPKDPLALMALARCRLLAGRPADARRACERALKADPALFRGQLLLARVALRLDNDVLRISALKTAADLQPGAIAIRVALAKLMLSRLNYKGAMAAAQEALALAPTDPTVRLIFVRCQVALDQLEGAKAFLAEVEERDFDATDLASLRQDLAVREKRASDVAASTVEPTRDEPAVAASSAYRSDSPSARESRPDTAPSPHIDNDFDAGQAYRDFLAIERRRDRRTLLDHLLLVWALILRDLQLHNRHNVLGVLMELVRPTIIVIAHYWLFYLLRKPMPANIPIADYVIAGFSTWFTFNAAWMAAHTETKWPGGATLFPGVTDIHLRVARASWSFMLNLVFCLCALLPLDLFHGTELSVPDVSKTWLVLGIAAGMGFGLGLVLERITLVVPAMKTIEKLLNWALFVTSGLYFSLADIPPLAADWFWYNPLIHLIESERNAFDPGYNVLFIDLRYPAVVMACLLLTGVFAHAGLRRPAYQ